MRTRLAALGVLLAAVCLQPARAFAADSHTSPLHGALSRGAHAVGFTRLQLADGTRPMTRPGENAAASPETRARRMDVHVWYPAAAGATGAPLTFADLMVEHLAGRPATELSQREAGVRRFLGEFGPVSETRRGRS